MARRTGENDGEGAIGGDSAERRGEERSEAAANVSAVAADGPTDRSCSLEGSCLGRRRRRIERGDDS